MRRFSVVGGRFRIWQGVVLWLGAVLVACTQPDKNGSSSFDSEAVAGDSRSPKGNNWKAASAKPKKVRKRRVNLARTQKYVLDSVAVGQSFEVLVSLPRRYPVRQTSFSVLYVLDPDYAFPIARNIAVYLSDHSNLTEVIVVGVGYGEFGGRHWRDKWALGRSRDYTLSRPAKGYTKIIRENSGGADKFLQFMAAELMPWVNDKYRTLEGENTLVGHSLGGLFGAYAILTKPKLFSRAILLSPSLWFDNRSLFSYEQGRHRQIDSMPLKLFLGVGALEGRRMLSEAKEFSALLQQHAYEGLVSKLEVFNKETHYSVFPTALSRGLVWAYGDK